MAAEIFGLVLAGGKSQRMGKDKGEIEWFGEPQRYFLANLLSKYCDEVFISCRADQVDTIKSHNRVIVDNGEYRDSYGAIISALSEHPHHAWLVVACDMPFIDAKSIQNLIQNRDSSKIATAYFNPENDLPEPMLAIWEPKALSRLMKLSTQGINCPRKALIKSEKEVKLIRPIDHRSIINVNTPKEAVTAREIIDGRK